MTDLTAAPLPEGPGAERSSRFPALESRGFRLFWAGQMISLTGTWVQSVAQQWLVLQLTKSAFQVGLIVTVQFLPVLVLSLFIGPLTDRMDKRKVLLATQVAYGILATILGTLALTHTVRYWHIVVIATCMGILQAIYVPARQSFVPELVPRTALLNAVALNSAIFNAARVIGPAMGGLLYFLTGPAWAFYINGISYIAVIVSLLLIRSQPVQDARRLRGSYLGEMREGLEYIRNQTRVLVLLILIGTASLFALNFTTLLPVFAKFDLHLTSGGFGALLAFQGAGSLLGAVVLSIWSRSDHARRLVYGGLFAFLVLELIVGFVRSFPLAAAILLPIGFFMTLFTTTANSRILDLTPANLQGRVMSVYSFLFLGMTPIGSLAAGAIAQKWGATVAFVLGAGITLLVTIAVYFVRQNSRRAPVPAG